MDDTSKTRIELERDENGRLLPGQKSLNPNGRPKGQTMKEFARAFLMNVEDKESWLKDLPKETVWRMAEGNPKQDTDVTSDGEKLQGVVYLPMKDATNTLDTPTKTDSRSD